MTFVGDVDEQAWRDTLKVGDSVIVAHGYGHDSFALRTVTKVTAKQIVVGTNGRYWRDSGRYLGSAGYASNKIIAPTPERLSRLRLQNALLYLRNVDWGVLPPSFIVPLADQVYALKHPDEKGISEEVIF